MCAGPRAALSQREMRKHLEGALSGPVSSDTPIRGIDDLLQPFHTSLKPRSQWRVGTEAEKFGLLAESLSPLPFEGPRSVQRVLALLSERHGWHPERESVDGDVIALTRDSSSITLEPAGQLELSGAPFANLNDAAAEFERHHSELRGISEELQIVWISLGFHPFARHDQLPRVTKQRYAIMERYLPTRGPRALDMMRRTCTVQANVDYDSEDDAIRKLRVGLALQPIVTALFANSPFYEGQVGVNRCERAAVWLGMDPDRTGMLPFAFESDMSFRSYVEWALDAPMFMVKRGARVLPNTHQTFRTFLDLGADGERATAYDWEMHLNTLFPEVRLKRTLEMRGADAQSLARTSALPALWKGVLYDPGALSAAESLIASLDSGTLEAARPEIARSALAATLAGRPVLRWAQDLFEIARAGLQRQAELDPSLRGEASLLAPLAGVLERGRCPADELLADLPPAAREDWRREVVARARF
jgi:glutamate--cysteine ligase